MLTDGIELTEGGSARRLHVTAGPVFPATPLDGELFRLTASVGQYSPGLYYWSTADASWVSGDITAVHAGVALQGGGIFGDITLNVDTNYLDARYPTLINGKLPASVMPDIAITNTSVVASQAEMLALVAQTGDVAIRTDSSTTWILRGTDSSQLSDWQQLPAAASGIQSVNGQSGANITLSIPYDVYSFIDGRPASGETLLRLKAGRTFNIAANFAGSRCDANAAASQQTVMLVKLNGTQVNTITFAANSKEGIFGNSAAMTIQPGDLLEVICPIVQDTTLSTVTICLYGNV